MTVIVGFGVNAIRFIVPLCDITSARHSKFAQQRTSG